jgi:hypothetical protein
MNPSRPDPSPEDQRQALERSERAANEKQPGSFKDEAMDDKVVEIPPVGPDEKPIRGLDPE